MTSTSVLNYTVNFKLALPTFDLHLWHDYINNDFKIIDAVLGHYLAVYHIVGVWQNSTLYYVGDRVIDGDSGAIFECVIQHTSAPPPTTFAQDRIAHPGYWKGALPIARFRGAWTNSTGYDPNDFVVSGSQYAVCAASHTSIAVPGHFIDDAVYWVVLIDLTNPGTIAAGPDPGTGSACVMLTNSTPQIYDLCSQGTTNNFVITDVTHGVDRFTLSGSTGIINFNQIPTFPTATPGDNTTKGATTAFVAAAVASVVGGTTPGIPPGTGLPGVQYQMVRYNASNLLAAEDAPYDLCFSTDDSTVYTNAYNIVRHLPVHPFILKATLPGARAGCVVAPTGSITVGLNKNGSSIGTINIAAAATTATFTFASDVSFNTSDILTIVAPGTADATLAGVFASLRGIRQ